MKTNGITLEKLAEKLNKSVWSKGYFYVIGREI